MTNEHRTVWLSPLGRLLLASTFLFGGYWQLCDWNGTVKHLEEKGFQYVPVALPIGVALEIAGGVLVLLGLYARIGALVVIVLLIPVTVTMHAFWKVDAAAQMHEAVQFLKNLSILRGLFLLVANGAGPLSRPAFLRYLSALWNT